MLDLEVVRVIPGVEVDKKVQIITELNEGTPRDKVIKKYRISLCTIIKLLQLYENEDSDTLLKLRLKNCSEPLIDCISSADRCRLRKAIDNASSMLERKKYSAILFAETETTYTAIASATGIPCSKTVKCYIENYLKSGMDGLKNQKTGKKVVPEYKHNKQLEYAKIGESLWKSRGQEGFVTDAEISNIAGVSETTVQNTLRSKIYFWRRSAKSWLAGCRAIAAEKGLRITSVNSVSVENYKCKTIKSTDKVDVACTQCGFERNLTVNSLKNEDSRCPRCKKMQKLQPRNSTEKFVIDVVEEYFRFLFGYSITFDRDKGQGFIFKHTGRRLRLDGFCSSLRVAIEYQGVLHEKPAMVKGINSPVDALKAHLRSKQSDRLKRMACSRENIELLEVDAPKSMTKKAILKEIVNAFYRSRSRFRAPELCELISLCEHMPPSKVGYLTNACKLRMIDRM